MINAAAAGAAAPASYVAAYNALPAAMQAHGGDVNATWHDLVQVAQGYAMPADGYIVGNIQAAVLAAAGAAADPIYAMGHQV